VKSKAQAGRRIAGKHLAEPNVTSQHLPRLVTGLALDDVDRHVIARGLGHAPGAKTVTRNGINVRQTGPGGNRLEQPADGVRMEAGGGDPADLVNFAENGPGADRGPINIEAERTDRAAGCIVGTPRDPHRLARSLLVGLRLWDRQDETFRRKRQVLDPEGCGLRSSAGARERHQHKRFISQPGESIGTGRDHAPDLRGEQGVGAKVDMLADG